MSETEIREVSELWSCYTTVWTAESDNIILVTITWWWWHPPWSVEGLWRMMMVTIHTRCHCISCHSTLMLSLQGCPWCPLRLSKARPSCQSQPLARPGLGWAIQAWGKLSSPAIAGAGVRAAGHCLGLASYSLLPTSLHSLIFYTRPDHLLTPKHSHKLR